MVVNELRIVLYIYSAGVPGKLVTSLVTEMLKIPLKPVTFSLPTHLTDTRWNVHFSFFFFFLKNKITLFQ